MNIEALVRSLATPLPEDILKRKWAGDLEGAQAAIRRRLAGELPQGLRDRLMVEQERLHRLPTQYPWNREQAFAKLCELVPDITEAEFDDLELDGKIDFLYQERLHRLPTQYPWNREQAFAKLCELVPDITEAEFDDLELDGKIDFLYLQGEKRYFVRFHRTLVKTIPALMARSGGRTDGVSPWLDPMIEELRTTGHLGYRITLQGAMHLEDSAFVPGVYRAHLPVPAPCAQQREIQIEAPGAELAPEDAPARTAYVERAMDKWEDIPLAYTYVNEIRYADPLHQPAPDVPLYPNARPVEPADLAEEAPYLRFTPYLRQLAAELAGAETEPVRKAKRFYDFVTQKVQYSFMRDYFQIDDLGEYCAVNLKGDCGLQALLFILLCRISGIPARWQSGLTIDEYFQIDDLGEYCAVNLKGDCGLQALLFILLCRISGIPARWQSGLTIDEDYVGSHDWAQFYVPGWGWLFADPSYGGGAWRNGNPVRHAFYFGNLDPMRMVANRCFQGELTPVKQQLRIDPYDNQSGELELADPSARPFTGRDLDTDMSLIRRERL